jgi:hypothetical protein
MQRGFRQCRSSDFYNPPSLCSGLYPFAQSTRVVLFVVDFRHVPTRDFPHQSPVCILLVHSILWCFEILRDGCEKCLRHNREAKSSMVSEKRRLFGIRSCVFWRIHSAQRHYSIRESVG